MNVLGIIAEYNPFHNGHLHHLQESRELCSADCVVCIMSGNFIQRGEPAIINKWARSEIALLSGVDLVIELPVVYSMASAEFFAYGAVKILDSLGIVNFLCFGSESSNIDDLRIIADVLCEEPGFYRLMLKEHLAKGFSFPASREYALQKYLEQTSQLPNNISSIIGMSNNILGIEYLKALKRLNSSISPYTIKRISNEYNSELLTGRISSATSIRKHVYNMYSYGLNNQLGNVLPEASNNIIKREFECGRGPVFPSNFENIIISTIRRMDEEYLKTLPFISEGLENRIKSAADDAGTLKELVEKITTRRYPQTRIQRNLFNLLLPITADDFEMFNLYGGPQYIRVLGFNRKGRLMLSEINQKSSLPVIMKASDFKKTCNPLLKKMQQIESAATDIYVLGYENSQYKKAGQEYTTNTIRIDIHKE